MISVFSAVKLHKNYNFPKNFLVKNDFDLKSFFTRTQFIISFCFNRWGVDSLLRGDRVGILHSRLHLSISCLILSVDSEHVR